MVHSILFKKPQQLYPPLESIPPSPPPSRLGAYLVSNTHFLIMTVFSNQLPHTIPEYVPGGAHQPVGAGPGLYRDLGLGKQLLCGRGEGGSSALRGQGPRAAGFSAQLSRTPSAPGGPRQAVRKEPSRGPACPVSLGPVTQDSLPEG